MNTFLRNILPKFGIGFLLFLGVLLSFTAHADSKISELSIAANSNLTTQNFTSKASTADDLKPFSKSPYSAIVSHDQTYDDALLIFELSSEENKDLEYISIECFSLIFQLNRLLRIERTVKVEHIPDFTFGKLFILFHNLKIFS